MLLLDAAPPPLPASAPWWAWLAYAAIPIVAPIVVAWLTTRVAGRTAGAKDSDLARRVETLEANEPADLAEARAAAEGALAEAKTATESAERVAGDLKRHVEDEQRRRDTAREIGQKRDEKLADKVEKLSEKVTKLAAQTELLLDGRVDTGGGSRRGR
jgi:outer membrane murein-binding lipoprotein Lpp